MRAKSDCEDNSKKINKIQYDSEASSSEEEKGNNNKDKCTNKKKYFININLMRELMARIKKNLFVKNIILDDSDIKNYSLIKRFKRKIDKQKIKKNKSLNLNSFKSLKYRTKSFINKPNLVFSILGFIEKKKKFYSIKKSSEK